MEWKEEYLIGINTIDEQHKRFFDLANNTRKLLNEPEVSLDLLIHLVEELQAYARMHLHFEENIMRESKYIYVEQHKLLHDIFEAQIQDVDVKIMETDKKKYLERSIVFLSTWLLNHILEEDKAFGVYYKSLELNR